MHTETLRAITLGCSVLLGALILTSLIPQQDVIDEIQMQNELYCEMVKLSLDTDGDLGWPITITTTAVSAYKRRWVSGVFGLGLRVTVCPSHYNPV